MAQVLPHNVGNYEGCIALAALTCGEPVGNADRIYETLEGIAKACVSSCEDNDPCLLAPVASGIGIQALLSPFGRGLLEKEIYNAFGISYPAKINDYAVSASDRDSVCKRLPGRPSKLIADETIPEASIIRHGQSLKTKISVSAFGKPIPTLSAEFGKNDPTTESLVLKRLKSISNLVLSSLGIPDNPEWEIPFIGPSTLEVWVGHGTLTLAERINGFVVSQRVNDRIRDKAYNPNIPLGSVVLSWPRIREVHIPISDSLLDALNLQPQLNGI